MKARVFLGLAALLVFSLFISLGVWQLHRAQTKRLLLNSFSRHAQERYIEISDLDKTDQPLANLRYAPITTKGYFDNAHVFLLDNKFYEHALGYEVLTPFFPQGSHRAILVNRGWIPRNPANYQALPIIPKVFGEQKIHGILYIPLSKPFLLKQMPISAEPHWPLIVQALQINFFEIQLKQNLYPAILWLDKKEENGFIRNWRPVFMQPAQHIAYAVQWFALALTLLVIYIALNIKHK